MKASITISIYFMVCFWHIALRAEAVITENIDYLSDVNYADGRDLLDVYMPQGAIDAPVIVFFHGGGLLAGDKTYGKTIATSLVKRGFGVVSANYRLSPNYAHPAHVQDTAAATAWVINNIAAYGGDAKNVFIAGHSAGAYLAALLAIDRSYLEKHTLGIDAVKGTILISPFLYVEETAPERIASNPIFKSIWGDKRDGWLKASVTPYIGPDRDNILVIYADGDDAWRKEQNRRFVAGLQREGNSNVAALEVANRNHRTIMSDILKQDDQIGNVVVNFSSQLVGASSKK